MQKILIAVAATLFAAGAAHAAESCDAQATAKKLAGAAKTSFMKKCEGDAKVSDAAAACEAQAKEKKLAGAASTSFLKKCEADAKTNSAESACETQAAEKKTPPQRGELSEMIGDPAVLPTEDDDDYSHLV